MSLSGGDEKEDQLYFDSDKTEENPGYKGRIHNFIAHRIKSESKFFSHVD